jgi:large subunit ribosomal protein L22
MTGPKLNEGSFVAGERSGTKASAKYVRMSASKVRAVLDLIRELPVRRADEVLQFTDREAARVVRKVLASAVANAVNNDEQLYVKAAFADEGPTLKRFTPRARGRAGRINKRTAHITVVVDRMSDDRIEVVQNREARRTAAGRRRAAAGGAAASRSARVARSRQNAAAAKAAVSGEATEAADEQVQGLADLGAAEAPDAAPTFVGAVAAEGDDAPEGHEIKGNLQSMLYHVPGSRYYGQTKAEYWFDTVENAEAAGFTAPPSQQDTDDSAEEAN